MFVKLEIQPDEDLPGIPELYDLQRFVGDTMRPLDRLQEFRWAAVAHPSQGLYPHAHVFMTGPRLTKRRLAELHSAAERSWGDATASWREVAAPNSSAQDVRETMAVLRASRG